MSQKSARVKRSKSRRFVNGSTERKKSHASRSRFCDEMQTKRIFKIHKDLSFVRECAEKESGEKTTKKSATGRIIGINCHPRIRHFIAGTSATFSVGKRLSASWTLKLSGIINPLCTIVPWSTRAFQGAPNSTPIRPTRARFLDDCTTDLRIFV